VSESTVYKWCRRVRETGSPAAKPHTGGGRSKVDATGAAVLTQLVEERNDRTLEELATGYHERTGVGVSISAVHRACARLDLRRKKKEPRARRAGA
jgi:transposase